MFQPTVCRAAHEGERCEGGDGPADGGVPVWCTMHGPHCFTTLATIHRWLLLLLLHTSMSPPPSLVLSISQSLSFSSSLSLSLSLSHIPSICVSVSDFL